MPQVLQVLRCYSCETFQVHIIKKINKWECKMCGEKQSIRKVYGRGSGQDCRRHVQRLNMMSMKQREAYRMFPVGEEVHFLNENDETAIICHSPEEEITTDEPESASSNCSRWNKFLDYPLEEHSNDGLHDSSSVMSLEVEGEKEEWAEKNTFTQQKCYEPLYSNLSNKQRRQYCKREILPSQQHKWQMFMDDNDCSDHRNEAICYSNLEIESNLSQIQTEMSFDSLKREKCRHTRSNSGKIWDKEDNFQNEQRENDLKGILSHSQSERQFDSNKQWNHGNPFQNRRQRKFKFEERKTNLQFQERNKPGEVQENKNSFFNNHCVNLKEIKNNIQFNQEIKSNETDVLWNGKGAPQDQELENFTNVKVMNSASQFRHIENASLNLQENVATDAASKDVGNNEILQQKSTFLSNISFNSISTKPQIFIQPSSKLQKDYDENELDKILNF